MRPKVRLKLREETLVGYVASRNFVELLRHETVLLFETRDAVTATPLKTSRVLWLELIRDDDSQDGEPT